MSARKIGGWLVVDHVAIDLFQIDGEVWFLAAQLEQAIKRNSYGLVAISPNLFSRRLMMFSKIDGKGHSRKFFSVIGARTLAAMAPTKTGLELFNLLCIFETDRRKKTRNKGSQ